ncbi:MAG: hypothetical protein VB111_10875 [Clostridiaceae bacterium]|nr:hypothetical protein [Clostridiaceae bacterium]
MKQRVLGLYWYEYSKTAQELRLNVRQDSTWLNSTYYYPSSWVIPQQYINSKSSDFDWCVIKTQSPIGNTTGWFGYGYTTVIYNKSIITSGYPDQAGMRYKQYMCTGIMNSSSSYRFYTDCDVEGGQSGSPAYDYDGIIWGVIQSASPSLNYGCLVTSTVYNTIESMK